LQKRFLDYNLAANTVVFQGLSLPQTGDILQASFRTAGSGGTLPQVLCTGAGGATNLATSQSLGLCTIPGDLLRAGDRLELLFDYSHEGASVGYQVEVRFGATPVLFRSAAASSTLISGRASLGIHAGGEQWSTQSWGPGSSLAAEAGAAAENLNVTLPVDFRGHMASPATETLTLRNFSVVRYPAP